MRNTNRCFGQLVIVCGVMGFGCTTTPEDTEEVVRQSTVSAFEGAGTNAHCEWIDGAHHGFVFPNRAVFDKGAAERHWELLHSMFDRTLKQQ